MNRCVYTAHRNKPVAGEINLFSPIVKQAQSDEINLSLGVYQRVSGGKSPVSEPIYSRAQHRATRLSDHVTAVLVQVCWTEARLPSAMHSGRISIGQICVGEN